MDEWMDEWINKLINLIECPNIWVEFKLQLLTASSSLANLTENIEKKYNNNTGRKEININEKKNMLMFYVKPCKKYT